MGYFEPFGELVSDAEAFACMAHNGQFRKFSNVPYVEHCRRVARRVCDVEGRSEVEIAAALLHDVVEDCGVCIDHLASRFGDPVALLVSELTNPSHGSKALRADRKRWDREHLKGVSRWAKVIKLLDRIDNLSEMDGHSESFKKLYAAESRQLLDECLSGVAADLELELSEAIIRLENPTVPAEAETKP